MRIQTGLLTLLLLAAAAGTAQAKSVCGELQNAYGPYDYRKRAEFSSNFDLVEGAHFTEDVRAGLKGITGSIGADLDYTLRAIPNHVPALEVMGRYSNKVKMLKLPGAKYPVECYFERAIRFQPDDGAAYAVYGGYLLSVARNAEALKMFQQAVELSPKDATVNYNTGLVYFRNKNYEKANQYAQKAYKLGFPLPGLKNMLVGAGKWVELPAEAEPAEAAVAPPAPAPAAAAAPTPAPAVKAQ